jgi:hypothetical protein
MSGHTVEFKVEEELYGVVPEPIPATHDMPDWYSELGLHTTDEYGVDINSRTAKACMPFLEATTRGWLLPLPADVTIRNRGGELEISAQTLVDCNVVDTQNPDWYGDNELVSGDHYPVELQTPWRADVPDEYMVWVLPPLNRRQYKIYEHFEPYSGIFSAGNTFRQLGIVGLLDAKNIHNVRIKAGTPIAQLVFMHRDLFAQDAVTKPMSESDMLRKKRDGNSKLINRSRYREEVWESLGAARYIPEDANDGMCPYSSEGDR